MDKIPARLLFTLNMYADYYFDASGDRMVKPLLGVRLFMQWGTGLSAQHLDMDLSCRVIYNDCVTTCDIL